MEKKILVAKAARMQCPGNDLFSCWGVEVGCFFSSWELPTEILLMEEIRLTS